MKARASTAVVLAALGFAGTANAGPAPPEIPAVSAYVEMVPTSRGSKPSATPARGRPTTLDANVERKLETEAGADAPLLKEVATSPAYGAPARATRRPSAAEARGDEGAAAAAVSTTSTSSSDRRLLGLGAILLLLTGAFVGASVAERRRLRAAQR